MIEATSGLADAPTGRYPGEHLRGIIGVALALVLAGATFLAWGTNGWRTPYLLSHGFGHVATPNTPQAEWTPQQTAAVYVTALDWGDRETLREVTTPGFYDEIVPGWFYWNIRGVHLAEPPGTPREIERGNVRPVLLVPFDWSTYPCRGGSTISSGRTADSPRTKRGRGVCTCARPAPANLG